MFDKLYKSIHSVLPNKGFALVITLSSLGGATFLPYLADRMIDDYDELRYEYMIQKDRIKLLQIENDSLQNKIREQSIEFSDLLYSASADFNDKIIQLEKKHSHILKKPTATISHKTDIPLPPINNLNIKKYVLDSTLAGRGIKISEPIHLTFATESTQTKPPVFKPIQSKKKTHSHTSRLFEFRKNIKPFNPDRKR